MATTTFEDQVLNTFDPSRMFVSQVNGMDIQQALSNYPEMDMKMTKFLLYMEEMYRIGKIGCQRYVMEHHELITLREENERLEKEIAELKKNMEEYGISG